jgi:hypothetical protein
MKYALIALLLSTSAYAECPPGHEWAKEYQEHMRYENIQGARFKNEDVYEFANKFATSVPEAAEARTADEIWVWFLKKGAQDVHIDFIREGCVLGYSDMPFEQFHKLLASTKA